MKRLVNFLLCRILGYVPAQVVKMHERVVYTNIRDSFLVFGYDLESFTDEEIEKMVMDFGKITIALGMSAECAIDAFNSIGGISTSEAIKAIDSMGE